MLDSVLNQQVQPVSVHIVDDGSSDRTPEILKAYCAKSPLVKFTALKREGARREGGESAIQVAFAHVNWDQTQVLARMDADVSFGPEYFVTLLSKFEQDDRLGIGSGLIYEEENGRWTPRFVPSYHTRGASKLYRRDCYDQIKPIGTLLGWDGQDGARANCYGWKTRTYEDAILFHHRPVGTSVGRIRLFRNLGLSAYYIGYHPLFFLGRAIHSVRRRPFLIGSIMMIAGMAEAYLRNRPREDRKEVISFVRRQQINRLLGRETIWR